MMIEIATGDDAGFGDSLDYVTVFIEEQMFGLPIERVQDVFITSRITPVPRAPNDIVGLLNLRGRIVTAICLRRRLGRAASGGMACNASRELTAVGIDQRGDAYALIVDSVGEVLRLPAASFEPPPVHLAPRWASLSTGVHRLEDRLLVVLDIDAVLAIDIAAAA